MTEGEIVNYISKLNHCYECTSFQHTNFIGTEILCEAISQTDEIKSYKNYFSNSHYH